MSMHYLCDMCIRAEYIASTAMVKCHGESGAIVPMVAIDWGKDDPYETCRHYKPREEKWA